MHEHEEAPSSVAHLLDNDGFVERLARHVVHRTYRTVADKPPRGVTKAAVASFRARDSASASAPSPTSSSSPTP